MNISSLPRPDSNYLWGRILEDALAEALGSRGWQLVDRRYRCPFGEIDLLVSGEAGVLLLIEVKSLSRRSLIGGRLGKSQKHRLRRSYQYIQGIWRGPVAFFLAMIETNGEVLWFDGEILS